MCLNCLAVVSLVVKHSPAMCKRGNGMIVNVSSTAVSQPMPHTVVYGATKIFVFFFTKTL